MNLTARQREDWALFINEEQANHPGRVAAMAAAFTFHLRAAPFHIQLAAVDLLIDGKVETAEAHNHFVQTFKDMKGAGWAFRLRIPKRVPEQKQLCKNCRRSIPTNLGKAA